ncbi:MAG TPA: hypothetical protein VFE46_03900 [Pirellulales bacterium]|jgi:hypothetical protein|nr:hypothetical protein [Pirellulales bacterium]
MSSCYKRVLQSGPLDSSAQGEGDRLGALWVLLSALDSVDSRDDSFPSNPATEVKFRLKAFTNNSWMREFATPFLTSLELKLVQ